MKKVYHQSLIPSSCSFMMIFFILCFFKNMAVIILACLIHLLLIISIKKRKLIIDEEGVWISDGLLPWTKGTYGYDWNVIEGAVYYQGFFSWLINSYRIEIRKLFKNDSLELFHIKNGQEAVIMINKIIKEKQNSSIIISNQ